VAIGQCFLDPCVIIEELLEGVEYSVDTVLFGGKLYAAGISERVFRSDRAYAVQIGSITPAALAKPLERAMYGLMERAADALGVDKGAFKGDLILCGDNVTIIEVTARTSGGFDSQYRKPYSYGIDILKCTIDIAMGNPFDPADLQPKWTKWSMTTSVFPAPGRVVSIRGLDEIQRMPAVRKVFMDLHVGDPVKPYEHCANRVNHIILCADTYDELMNAEMAVHSTLEIVTVP
jgi:biotin carboxylase